jgi:hypothetical protein
MKGPFLSRSLNPSDSTEPIGCELRAERLVADRLGREVLLLPLDGGGWVGVNKMDKFINLF